MCAKLADMLEFERKGSFVGRDLEISIFQKILLKETNTLLLYFYGPGGQGKTTLMKKCIDVCQQYHIPYIHLDGREINAHPSSFIESLHSKLSLRPFEDVIESLDKLQREHVLFIDTYEKLSPIDDWIRTVFLPQLPTFFSTVIFGRNPLSLSWTIDPGWKKYMQSIQLRNLSPDQANQFLVKRHLPSHAIPEILSFTHGHPLALSLVADMYSLAKKAEFNPDQSPDLIKSLLELFVQNVPGPAHRAALEISALAHFTSESLLQEVLGMEQVQGLFDWLRNLSFFDQNNSGIFPHDIARETLSRDVKWRNPDWYHALHDKIRNYYIKKLSTTNGVQQRIVLNELIFLHRLNPMVKPFFDWAEHGSYWQDQYKMDQDFEPLYQMVLQHEGIESAELFSYWANSPASEIWVYRNPEQQALAFVMRIQIQKIKAETPDQFVNEIKSFADTNWNLRQEDHISLFRYWMAKESYQNVSNLQSVMFLSIVQYYFTPGLSISMLLCREPEFWKVVLNYADLTHMVQFDFTVAGNKYGWYMHDWRKRPPLMWLELLGKREVEMVDNYDEASREAVSVLILSEEEFDISIQQAIRNYHQSDLLLQNPILKSRLVLNKAGNEAKDAERIKILRERIDEALKIIEASPVDSKFYRVLQRTFVNPVGAQEKVADYLNMSFSTYRRYLKTALEKLSRLLWNMELENG